MKINTLLFILILLALPSATFAEETVRQNAEPVYTKNGIAGLGLVIAPKVGVGFGQPFNEFGTSPVFELELGWLLRFFPDLQIFTSLQYARSTQDGQGKDSRFPQSGDWSYNLVQQSLILTPGLLYRAPFGGDLLAPYLSAGPRFHFNEVKIDGETAGSPFGEHTETGTAIGFYGALGVDVFLGPGSILAEVQMSWVSLDQYVLQDTNGAALNLAIGYRFFF